MLENNVQFDDLKSELIHFEKVKKYSTDLITLSDNIVLKPQTYVK